MSTANKLLGERYQFIEVLGSSQMGQTLLVADVHYPGHPKCVLRQIRLPTRNPMTLKFLLRLLEKKVEVLHNIGQHKQIPSTFSSFQANRSFYLAQEFVPGRSLKEELLPGQPMAEPIVLAFLQEALTVLAYAQEHGVIHGSLKPSKLIRHETDDYLVILDFGRIRDLSQDMASRETTAGYPQSGAATRVYIAMEQRTGRPRFCTDHYALGMIAIQALTGLPVEELPEASHPNTQKAIVSLLQNIPGLGLNTASLLARMVHTNPDRRYQKAVEILADLERLQQDPQASIAGKPITGIASFSGGALSGAPIAGTPIAGTPVNNNHSISGTPISAIPTGGSGQQPTVIETDEPDTRLPTIQQPNQKRSWAFLGAAGIAVCLALAGVFAWKLPQRFLATQRIRNAEAAEATQDFDTALSHYTRSLELYPDNPQALAHRSQLAFEQGDTEMALADITRAIELAPENQTFSYERGNIRFAVGDTQGAIADYTSAIQQDETFVKAYVNRGSARAAWGDDEGAVEDYTEALQLDPPVDVEAAAYLNRCLSHSNLGEQVLALEDCSEAIDLRPSHALAYQNRGLVRRRLGDSQGALQDYNIAIQIEPDSPDPYYNRGLTRQLMNDLPGAMQDFTQALTIAPDYVFALYDRGLLNVELGNRADAIADFRSASQVCLELGRTGCYEDALYQISLLEDESSQPSDVPESEVFSPP
ncbi:MAG: protein kinase family protein [Cyanobacteria bacterium J06638_20]